MKQLTIISGKGGTGKTSLTAAFASLAQNTVFADCDVDAADLHLILKPTIQHTTDFYGLQLAHINHTLCTTCKQCITHCTFNAINDNLSITPSACEGCKVCTHICPVNAITMHNRLSGYAYHSTTRFGPMAHAALNTAEEASGKLVTLVREHAKKLAEQHHHNLILIDGPPGIGCPVIAAITGVDLVLIITEPTLSAIHDLKRILNVTTHFSIPAVVCINKYDINQQNTKDIQDYCTTQNIDIIGTLPYDTQFTKAMIHEQTIIEYTTNQTTEKIKHIWNTIHKILKTT